MIKKHKLITFFKKLLFPIYLTVFGFLNTGEDWAFWPLWRKLIDFIIIAFLYWIFWHENGTQILPWYKDGKKEKK